MRVRILFKSQSRDRERERERILSLGEGNLVISCKSVSDGKSVEIIVKRDQCSFANLTIRSERQPNETYARNMR